MTRALRCHALVLGLAAALALSGCGGGQAPSPSAGAGGLEKAVIKVGTLPVPDAVALYIADARGLFAAEGLTVEPVTITGVTAALPQVESGALDVSQTTYVSTFLAVSKGRKIKLVADMYRAAPGTFTIMVQKNSPIRTVADLKGKTILVNTLGNIATLAVTTQLKAAGLAATDVTFAKKPFPEMGNAITSGQADAGWVTEPFITASSKALGFRTIADTMTGPTAGLPIAGWMASEQWARQNPKTLAAFQRAISKAQQIASSDRKAVEAALPTYTNIDRTTAEAITLGAYPSTLEASRLQKVADLMLEHNYIDAPIDVKSVMVPPDDR
ncbi:ABC transporter substrate-binding protein [Nonomuraea sp. NPDC046802]|uniref:ABC transporter substrate-binding protein n=1 Tax=Nonomuraea sp. NPDC046802 TaxID=3154919 RepID=UPI0033ECB1D1